MSKIWTVLVGLCVVVGCEQATTVNQCEPTDGKVDKSGDPLQGVGGGAGAVDDVCEPGAAYVCECDDNAPDMPNLGNKYCSWDGSGFGPCELCGEGPAYLGETGISCNQTPPSQPGDPPLVECPKTSGVCWGYQCDNVKKKCSQISFIEGSAMQDVSPNDCYRPVCDGAGDMLLIPDASDCSGACDSAGLCVP